MRNIVPIVALGALLMAACAEVSPAASVRSPSPRAPSDEPPSSSPSPPASPSAMPATPLPAEVSREPAITCDTAVEQEGSERTIAEWLSREPRFERFCELVEGTRSAGLGLSWLEIWHWPASRMGDNRNGVTVFAPTNEAFAALDAVTLSALLDGTVDNELRYRLLGHHYIHRLYPSDAFEPGPQPTWRGAGSVELRLDPLVFGDCGIVETDIRATNGFIHAIDCIVVPPDVADVISGAGGG